MSHYHSVLHFKFDSDAFTSAPLSIRRLMEIALESAANKNRNIPTEENFKKADDLREQLEMLDAIDFGYIHPVLGQA